jgi:hypothetical protein
MRRILSALLLLGCLAPAVAQDERVFDRQSRCAGRDPRR